VAGLKAKLSGGGTGADTVGECQGLVLVGLGVTGTGLLHRSCLPCHGSPRSLYCLNGVSTAAGQDHYNIGHKPPDGILLVGYKRLHLDIRYPSRIKKCQEQY
jgi:hypothetical protein